MATSASHIAWLPELPPADQLDGVEVVHFPHVRAKAIAAARAVGTSRTDLANPAERWLGVVRGARGLCVTGVELRDATELRDLHDFVIAPAWRYGTPLTVVCPVALDAVDDAAFVEPELGHPYTLERSRYVLARPYPPPIEGRAGGDRLDDGQATAAGARDGVVQIIAPAGSGKTTVLVQRVRELLRRGVPAERILCTTFNRDAAIELAGRLASAGVAGVQARTFHALGLQILREEGRLRDGGVATLSLAQWRRLALLAQRSAGADGVWIEPGDARAAISDLKLGRLLAPEDFARQAGDDPHERTLAALYRLYEAELRDGGRHDFDDLIAMPVALLAAERPIRRRWQGRFQSVLVDEYQDIEPAQERLIRILAAPNDSLFCVGDEDQTLYAWRRASVRRMVELDQAYPGLHRVALGHNYRCPPTVVAASRRLVEHNRVRFPKAIAPDPRRPAGDGGVEVAKHASLEAAGLAVGAALRDHARGSVAVLARTTSLLRQVALGCARHGVRIAAPPAVFEEQGARAALTAYLRLVLHPTRATTADVLVAMRAPNRSLPVEAAEPVAGALRDGASWRRALDVRGLDARQAERLADAADVMAALRGARDAAAFVRTLRTRGGLDRHFAAYEQAFGDVERVDVEALEAAEREARGQSPAEYLAVLEGRVDALAAIRDDEQGIELTTVHKAKGREWPVVHVFGCDDHQLPNARSLEDGDPDEAMEGERRIAYVAFTRAQRRLLLHHAGSPSAFLAEAGLIERPAPARPARRPEPGASGAPARARRTGDAAVDAALDKVVRVGVRYAVRTAPDGRVARAAAAAVLEQGLVGEATASASLNVGDLAQAIAEAADGSLADLGLPAHRRLTSLSGAERMTLARLLRRA